MHLWILDTSRRSWTVFAVVMLLLLLAMAGLWRQQFRQDLDKVDKDTHHEVNLLASITAEMLRRGQYQNVDEMLNSWGNSDILNESISVTARNGAVIGSYKRNNLAGHAIEISLPIDYSYSSQATLTLRHDLVDVYNQGRSFATQLTFTYTILGLLLGALMSQARSLQREANMLRKQSLQLNAANEKLHEKNVELERYNQMVSHDLKSPLVTIKTFLGYLKEDMVQGDAARIEKDMGYMSKAADKMGQLLDELMEISSIGRKVSMPVRLNFREVVQEALVINAGAIAQHGVAVTVDDADITMLGERLLLVQVWQNLIDNAVKFMGSQPKPQIRIGVEKGNDTMRFYMCDNGMGIDKRYHDKIFGMFEKLDSQAQGTGLGLALVKRIVQLYRGEIYVESGGIGHGACFRFTLPEALKNGTSGGTSA